jgi:hypothetical protein
VGDSSASRLTTSGLTERHTRVLKNVPKDKRKDVLAEAAKAGEVTVESLEKAAAQHEAEPSDGPPKLRDATGLRIPEALLPLWHRRDKVEDLIKSLNSIRSTVKRITGSGDILFRECDLQAIETHLTNANAQIKLAVPHAVCPYCLGVTFKNCSACKGRGFMSKFKWDNTVPEEMKRLRELFLDDERKNQ